MSICNRCQRSFVYKNSLRRHQLKRRNPCRPAVTSCAQCGNTFTCFDSLKKHKKLYCKAEQQHQQQQHSLKIDLQDFLNQLPSSANASSPLHNNHDDDDDDADARYHHQLYTPQPIAEFTPPVPTNTYFHTDSLQELLNQINFSPLMTNDDSNNNNNNIAEKEEECKTNIHATNDVITDYDDNDNGIVNVDNGSEEKLQ